MNSFKEVIESWPHPKDLAADISAKPGTVHVWKTRDSIPRTYWAAVCRAAARRGIEGVTLELFASLSAAVHRAA